MKKRVPVSQIMSKELVKMVLTQSLSDAEKLFKMYNIRHIPVVDGNKLVGMISQSDLLRISYSELSDDEEKVDSILYDAYSLSQVMTQNPVTLESDATIRDAAELLSKHSFHSVPVVDNGELVGMITSTDLIEYLLEQY